MLQGVVIFSSMQHHLKLFILGVFFDGGLFADAFALCSVLHVCLVEYLVLCGVFTASFRKALAIFFRTRNLVRLWSVCAMITSLVFSKKLFIVSTFTDFPQDIILCFPLSNDFTAGGAFRGLVP